MFGPPDSHSRSKDCVIGDLMTRTLDDIDEALLRRLMDEGRTTWADLAKEVGLTPPSVTERVRKLERDGIIRSIEAVVHPPAVGYELMAYISVSASVAFDPPEFFERVRANPQVLECHLLTGEYDYLLKVVSKNSDHLYEVLKDIQQWPGVGHTRSSLVLRTAKDTRAIPLDAAP